MRVCALHMWEENGGGAGGMEGGFSWWDLSGSGKHRISGVAKDVLMAVHVQHTAKRCFVYG